VAVAEQAARFLRGAAKHWYDPGLVAGNGAGSGGGSAKGENWEEIVTSAMEAGSPLVRAASVLLELGSAAGAVDVCLVCAGNFGGSKVKNDAGITNTEGNVGGVGEEAAEDMLEWEKGLYHRPFPSGGEGSAAGGSAAGNNDSGSAIRSIVSGMEVTNSDALRVCHAVPFHFLSKLLDGSGGGNGNPATATENRLLAEQLVAACAASSDKTFLHSLYAFLLDISHEDTLLRVDSASLETWLKDVRKNVGLLWRYYSFHERNVCAGDVVWKRACTVKEEVPLSQRIECLTRAVNSFSAAMEAMNNGGYNTGGYTRGFSNGVGGVGGRFANQPEEKCVSVEDLRARITQINEQLEVASLQRRILAIIDSSENVDLDASKLSALSSTLVSMSDLYNVYAAHLNLYGMCLLIIHASHNNEAEAVRTLWKSIICEEILPCRTSSALVKGSLDGLKHGSLIEEEVVLLPEESASPSGAAGGGAVDLERFENGDWVPRLKNRIVELGKDLYGKNEYNYAFPVDLIVGELEGIRQVYDSLDPSRQSSPWPVQALIEAKVSYFTVLESYDALLMHDSAVVGGVDTATRLHRISSISNLLELWVSAAVSSRTDTSLNVINLPQNSSLSSALSQLAHAVRPGGLMGRIDSYKSSLEGIVGGNNNEITRIHSSLAQVEEDIRNEFR